MSAVSDQGRFVPSRLMPVLAARGSVYACTKVATINASPAKQPQLLDELLFAIRIQPPAGDASGTGIQRPYRPGGSIPPSGTS
jgi:hypothetical protein